MRIRNYYYELPKEALENKHLIIKSMITLLPEATVLGTNFFTLLPSLSDLTSKTRLEIMQTVRNAETFKLLKKIAENFRLNKIDIPRTLSGERKWPSGFIGSITHKSSIIIVTMTNSPSIKSIGIDIELHDTNQMFRIHNLVAPEGIFEEDIELELFRTFSVKEAIYKAYYSAFKITLSFKDIQIHWFHLNQDLRYGFAICFGLNVVLLRSVLVNKWVASVAIIFNNN